MALTLRLVPRRAATVAALVALLLAGSAHAARAQIALPVSAERGRVTVRAQAGLDGVAHEVAAGAPATLERIAADLPDLPRPERVEIRLVKASRDLDAAAPPGHRVPPWAAGVAFPREGVVAVATRREAHAIDVRSVVDHELAHMALGAALGGRAPRWLNEGFAYLHSSDFSAARLRTLTGMAWTGDAIPLSSIDRSFPAREHAASRAYAQSYDLVAFLARRGRHPDVHDDGDRWPLRRMLANIAAGMSAEEAALEAYNAPLGELVEEWFRSLRDRYFLAPVGLVGLGVWVLGALLLVLGYIRRRRQHHRVLRRWEAEEAAWAAEPSPEP